jgi:hypothetical protein
VGVSQVSQVSLNNNNNSSSSAEAQVEIQLGVIDHQSMLKSEYSTLESSISSENLIFIALIFQFEILFSNVVIVSILGFVESIVNASEF